MIMLFNDNNNNKQKHEKKQREKRQRDGETEMQEYRKTDTKTQRCLPKPAEPLEPVRSDGEDDFFLREGLGLFIGWANNHLNNLHVNQIK